MSFIPGLKFDFVYMIDFIPEGKGNSLIPG